MWLIFTYMLSCASKVLFCCVWVLTANLCLFFIASLSIFHNWKNLCVRDMYSPIHRTYWQRDNFVFWRKHTKSARSTRQVHPGESQDVERSPVKKTWRHGTHQPVCMYFVWIQNNSKIITTNLVAIKVCMHAVVAHAVLDTPQKKR